MTASHRLSKVRVFGVAAAVVLGALLPGAALAQSAMPSTTPAVPVLGWYDDLTGGPDMLDVVTTVAPISSIARDIGGDRIRLHGLIPDAVNSHTFEPTPSDAKQLANADLIIVNGLHL